MSFKRPVSADFSIREFAMRCEENADGWGLGWYPDQSVAVVKEPVRWQDSQYTGFLEKYQHLLSSLYIAHVRHRTTGGTPTHADTHPFTREYGGRDYCFAHNGTLTDVPRKSSSHRYLPIGATDSERTFCYLLDQLAVRGTHLDSEADWRWLHAQLAGLNEHGKLNCLLADGKRFFAYRDINGHKGLVFRRLYLREGETRRFDEPEFQVALEGKPDNEGYVVATNALSSHGWNDFQFGELMVFREGKLEFSSHRRR